MRLQIAVLSVLLIGWSALSSNAKAEMLCAERENVIQGLERGYAEMPISMGLAESGVLIEVFTSPAGTFTIVMTPPRGTQLPPHSGRSLERTGGQGHRQSDLIAGAVNSTATARECDSGKFLDYWPQL